MKGSSNNFAPTASGNRHEDSAEAVQPRPGTTLPLLVEIGCEEIPARYLAEAQGNFAASLRAALAEARLLPNGNSGAESVLSYSTPRRLVVFVPHILKKQPDQVERVLGPPVKVAFDEEGAPTRAAESFAAKYAVRVDSLARVETAKGEYLAVERTREGRASYDVLREALPLVIGGLAFPKSMYWTAKSGPRFVRPIRWLLAILGEGRRARVVPFEIARVASGCWTHRHRRVGSHRMRVRSFADYAEKLREGMVEFDPERRRETVQQGIKALLQDSGLSVVADKDLEDWVVASTEWPRPILGRFEERFLKLPREILVTVMRDHQKYFAVEEKSGKIEARFISVLNVEGDPRGLIRSGHERVLTARFTDAEFFWKADQKVPLRDRLPLLEKVTYHDRLGSYAKKVARMKVLAREICSHLEVKGSLTSDQTKLVLLAVELCKCDLITQMVQEFPELQGIVGGRYAEAQGEPREVWQGIYDQYLPQGADDKCPRSLSGAVVSLVDKVDSVVAGFSVGLEPSGSSDPFGLRRQGNGIIRLLLDDNLKNLELKLDVLLKSAAYSIPQEVGTASGQVVATAFDFLKERLRYHLESYDGIEPSIVRAALGGEWHGIVPRLRARAKGLAHLVGSEDFSAVCTAAKRIRNILTKSATTNDRSPGDVDRALLEPGAEIELYEAYRSVAEEADRRATAGQYDDALRTISTLRPVVDRFFDKVLVMAEDKAVRQNRLRLLDRLNQLFSGIADLSQIESTTLSRVDAPTSRAAAGDR